MESFTRVAALCCNICLFDSVKSIQMLHKIFFVGKHHQLVEFACPFLEEMGL